jgi:hypothetical protein
VVAAAVLGSALQTETLDAPFQSVESPNLLPAYADQLQVVADVTAAITLLAVLVAAASLVTRYRRSRAVERQQLRWMVAAAALAGLMAAVILSSRAIMGSEAEAVWGWATGVYVAVLPLATGAAILRYRLYDLDRISRTLGYGLLTVLLGVGYAGVVLGLGQLLGEGSSLAVAGATLPVAAAFQPARRRVQQVVDRRFNRRRYDAARTIEAFTARLRDELDLDTLTGELLAVVDQTIQPTQAFLWLRPQAPSGTAGAALARQPT